MTQDSRSIDHSAELNVTFLRARDRHRMAETREERLGESRHRGGAMAVE